MDDLVAAIRPIRRRLLLLRALEAGLDGGVGGAALAAVVTVLRILMPQATPLAAEFPLLPLVLVPLGFVATFLVRLEMGVTLREAALAADRAAGLRERLATALEVAERRGEGILDGRLVAEAVAAASRLDPHRLPLVTGLGRPAKVLLVGVLLIAGASMIPSVGGPAVSAPSAERAAEALRRLADSPSLAPAIRRQVEEAAETLCAAGLRRDSADQATASVYRAVQRTEQARQAVAQSLSQAPSPEVRQMVSAATGGDGPGAAGAANRLADRLGSQPGSGGMPPDERTRLADSLSGAAAEAAAGHLDDLARALAAAAEAVKKPADPPTAAEALGRLASAMTEALGRQGAVAAALETLGQVRRTMGLPATPAGGEAVAGSGTAAPPLSRSDGPPPSFGELRLHADSPPHSSGAGAGRAVPASVRPEDRDVVRRYFGG